MTRPLFKVLTMLYVFWGQEAPFSILNVTKCYSIVTKCYSVAPIVTQLEPIVTLWGPIVTRCLHTLLLPSCLSPCPPQFRETGEMPRYVLFPNELIITPSNINPYPGSTQSDQLPLHDADANPAHPSQGPQHDSPQQLGHLSSQAQGGDKGGDQEGEVRVRQILWWSFHPALRGCVLLCLCTRVQLDTKGLFMNYVIQVGGGRG